jgi:hypothetical protein
MKYLLALFLMLATPAFADPYGSINAAGGGFAPDLWSKADGQQIQKLLALLPETVLSPSTHDLVRRALLTKANAPGGISDADFLRDRALALLQLGDVAEAGGLLRSAPPAMVNADIAKLIVDGQFYAGLTESACLDVRVDMAVYQDPYWKRAMIVCEIAAGQRDQAATTVDAIGGGEDKDFVPLVHAVLKSAGVTISADTPSALDTALLRLGNMRLPPQILTNDDVAIMAGVARTVTFAPSTRVEAAYAAAVQGGFGADPILTLLRMPGAQQNPPAGLTIARDDPTSSLAEASHRQASLVQALEHSKDSPERVQDFYKLLTVDSDNVDVPYLARIEYVRLLPISSDRVPMAAAAARGFFMENDTSTAGRWYDIALGKNGGAASPDVDRIWPLAHISFDQLKSPQAGADLQSWVSRTLASDPEEGPKRVERVLSVVSALGEKVPDSVWAQSVGKPDDESTIRGSMAVSMGLNDAAQRGSRGEVILLAAMSLKDGPGHAHPENLNHAIAALWKVGLQNPAQALALEGLAPVTALPEQ